MNHNRFAFWGAAVLAVCCLGAMVALLFHEEDYAFYYTPDREESYMAGSFDQLQIWRIYQLDPADNPSHIPTKDFELNGWSYHMLRIDKEETDGQTVYTAIFNGTKIPKQGVR